MSSQEDAGAVRARIIGRYVLCSEIATGGMASVHIGRLLGPVGFARTVAIKRLHPQYARDPEFVSMFLDEARLAARIRHRNVVSVLDVVALDGELFLVMDFVHGDSVGRLMRAQARLEEKTPIPVVAAILCGALHGLHAAHEAMSERGERLEIVHRDVSPQNILVGTDGVAMVADFGVARAANRISTTSEGQIKGKLSYMAPEQLLQQRPIDRRADIYAASVVLWEMLTTRRLFGGDNAGGIIAQALEGNVNPPSQLRPEISPELEAVVMRGLSLKPKDRFETAEQMAEALEEACSPASPAKVGAWVKRIGGEPLKRREHDVALIERRTSEADDEDLTSGRLLDALRSASIADVETTPSKTPIDPLAEPGSGPSRTATTLAADASASIPGLRPRRSSRTALIAGGVVALLAVGWGATLLARAPAAQPSLPDPGTTAASTAVPRASVEVPPPPSVASTRPVPEPPARTSALPEPPGKSAVQRPAKPTSAPPASSNKPKAGVKWGDLSRN